MECGSSKSPLHPSATRSCALQFGEVEIKASVLNAVRPVCCLAPDQIQHKVPDFLLVLPRGCELSVAEDRNYEQTKIKRKETKNDVDRASAFGAVSGERERENVGTQRNT